MLFYGTGPPPPPRNAQQRAHSLRQPIPPADVRGFNKRKKQEWTLVKQI